MTDDATLLRRYAENRSEPDFAELVRRHLNLVYSVALRQLNGDAHLAQDAAQLVFTDLARKAGRLAGHRTLSGWLFTSTRYAAAKLVRTERRRHQREQEAHRMNEALQSDPSPALDWERVRPVLDDALAELGERDREAVLLRFFEGRDYAEVGARIELTDNAARMRVDRAVDRLRGLLERRGISSTTAALAVALANQAVTAAPAGLAASVTGAALAGSAAAGGTALASFMSMTKLQIGLATAVIAAGAGTYAVQEQDRAALASEIGLLRAREAETIALGHENARLARAAGEVDRLRQEDAEFARLRDEALALKGRLQQLARAAIPPPAVQPAAVSAPSPAEGSRVPPLDQPPKPTFQTPPAYPAALRLAGVTGSATISFVVANDGSVRDVVAIDSTHEAFEAPAVEAVRQWKFAPGRKGGKNVNTLIAVPIVFTIKDGEAAPTWF